MPRIDFPQPTSNSPEFESDGDDDIEDEHHESESENDCIEEEWVPRDEDFGARVLRATENNSGLAARLGPQLYKIFHEEESSIVGFWEMGYRKRGGNSNDYTAGTPGGGGDYLSTNTGQNITRRKRQKTSNKDNGDGNDNDSQDGDRDDDGTHTGSSAEASKCRPFACPFNKKDPSKYNSSYRWLKGETEGNYKGCELGYLTYHRLRYALVFLNLRIRRSYYQGTSESSASIRPVRKVLQDIHRLSKGPSRSLPTSLCGCQSMPRNSTAF